MGMIDAVRRHYELYPYPSYPLFASIRRYDTYAINLEALWARFNGALPPVAAQSILIAGCGSFAPYPFSAANPAAAITALDLSRRSLGRARLHCLLHGCLNVRHQDGDLLDPAIAPGPFGLIDAYGVLHHLDDQLQGLKALATQLAEGGILRLMLYSRYARREEESIRRALRLLKIDSTAVARRLIARARPGSRLRRYADSSCEAGFESGLADALLHPRVHTFRSDELMDLVRNSGLEVLIFAHNGALEDVASELSRIRAMEERKQSPGNFVLYLGRNPAGPCSDDGSLLMLNPCLAAALRVPRLGTLQVAQRLGQPPPGLGRNERSFLRQFIEPVQWNSLTADARAAAKVYIKALFLLQYRG